MNNQDIIVHLAAETGTGQSMYQIAHYNNVNVGGTALLLDLLTNCKHKIKKVLVASSRAVYGEGKYFSKELGVVYPCPREDASMSKGNFDVYFEGSSTPLQLMPTDELSKVHPSSVYGITKQVQEQLVMTVCSSIGINAVALRYQNVYGPGQSLTNPYTGILSIFSTRILNGNGINIFEDGEESRDFVYIDDTVEATTLCIEKSEANGQVFNVGSGVPVNVRTVVETLMNNYKIAVPVKVTGNYRLGDIRHNYADISKIRNLLGFLPVTSFIQGVSKFTEWVNTQQINKDFYNESIEEMKAKGLYK
jgi:dTDP-L-rhamnose 4-epimerase